MKFTVSCAVLALAGYASAAADPFPITLAARQASSSGSPCAASVSAIPSCALPCLNSAAVAVSCATDDYQCQCSSSQSAAIVATAASCVISACDGAVMNVEDAADALCSCVSANPTLPCTSSPASTTSAPTSTLPSTVSSVPTSGSTSNPGSLPVSSSVSSSSVTIVSSEPSAPPPPHQNWSTSTVYTTYISTIISCAPTVTNCPAHSTQLTTVTVALSTTICPVTETQSSSSVIWSSPISNFTISGTGIHKPPPVSTTTTSGISGTTSSLTLVTNGVEQLKAGLGMVGAAAFALFAL